MTDSKVEPGLYWFFRDEYPTDGWQTRELVKEATLMSEVDYPLFVVDPVIRVAGSSFISVTSLSTLLGYKNYSNLLSLAHWEEKETGCNPIPPRAKGKSRGKLLIPLYGAIRLAKHAKTPQARQAVVYLMGRQE